VKWRGLRRWWSSAGARKRRRRSYTSELSQESYDFTVALHECRRTTKVLDPSAQVTLCRLMNRRTFLNAALLAGGAVSFGCTVLAQQKSHPSLPANSFSGAR
jgi:hypothetical protein